LHSLTYFSTMYDDSDAMDYATATLFNCKMLHKPSAPQFLYICVWNFLSQGNGFYWRSSCLWYCCVCGNASRRQLHQSLVDQDMVWSHARVLRRWIVFSHCVMMKWYLQLPQFSLSEGILANPSFFFLNGLMSEFKLNSIWTVSSFEWYFQCLKFNIEELAFICAMFTSL